MNCMEHMAGMHMIKIHMVEIHIMNLIVEVCKRFFTKEIMNIGSTREPSVCVIFFSKAYKKNIIHIKLTNHPDI